MTTPPPARGHLPTLIACFLHFDLSFMLWVLLGALGVFVAEDLGLSAAEKGLVVALPLLTGSLLRIPVGFASDRLALEGFHRRAVFDVRSFGARHRSPGVP